MNIESFSKSLEQRIFKKSILSFLIIANVVIIIFGAASVAYSFDSLLNDKPEYLKSYDFEVHSLKRDIARTTRNIENILKDKVEVTSGIENNLKLLAQQVKGVSDSIDGFSKAFNMQKYSIVESHFSSKRVLLAIFSIFILIYVKFLIDLYKYNMAESYRIQSLLDAILLSSQRDDDGDFSIKMDVLKELLPMLESQFKSSDDNKEQFNHLINKLTNKP